jgi:hypothetical protein
LLSEQNPQGVEDEELETEEEEVKEEGEED